MTVAASYRPPNLSGRIALVAGATRGTGRGIALALGEGGATVYCTGRSTRSKQPGKQRKSRPAAKRGKRVSPFDLSQRPETIEETAEMVAARGGRGIPVVVDHTQPAQVEELVARIYEEQKKLHILVNDIWGGDALVEFGKTFWQVDLDKGFRMLESAVHTHIITSRYAAPGLIDSCQGEPVPGLIVEVTDGDSYTYRGNLFYDLVKTTVIRLAFAMGHELRRKNVAAVALTPGYLRSEAMLDHFGVSEANWQDASKKEPNFAASETPLFAGRAVAALAADPNILKKSGRVFSSWGLSDEYGFTDADGRRPHWGEHFVAKYGDCMKSCGEAFYEHWFGGPIDTIYGDWP